GRQDLGRLRALHRHRLQASLRYRLGARPMIREERPIVLSGEEASLNEFAERLAEWVVAPEGRHMRRVAGVYGGRGTGKTSVLMAVLEKLRRRTEAAEATADPVRLILPNPESPDPASQDNDTRDDNPRDDDTRGDDPRELRRAIFAPAESRDG